jgi:fructokinase
MKQQQPIIIGLGEILWDMLPEGKKLGGAPTNFAYHCSLMGAESLVLSSVGDDDAGQEILNVTADLGIDTGYIKVDNSYPTGTVSVKIDKEGHPDYTIHENVAWDNIRYSEADLGLASNADAICFGSLAQRNAVSRMSIVKILEACRKDCVKVFDINLRQDYFSIDVIRDSMKIANILKLNDEELEVVSDLLKIKGTENEILEKLLANYNLDLVALTKGSEGSVLITSSKLSMYNSEPVQVADSVGAGDSFTAALVIGLLNDFPLHKIHQTASELAAFVCTKQGATPEVPPAVFNAILKTT